MVPNQQIKFVDNGGLYEGRLRYRVRLFDQDGNPAAAVDKTLEVGAASSEDALDRGRPLTHGLLDHPKQRNIGAFDVVVTTAYVAVNASEPDFFDMGQVMLWIQAGYGKGLAPLIEGHGVITMFDALRQTVDVPAKIHFLEINKRIK